MADYIERDAAVSLLEEKLRDICPLGRCSRNAVYGTDRDLYDAIEADIDALYNIPAADVAPVVRGQWVLERDPDGKPYCFHCSVCDDDFHHIGIIVAYDYCPNCGAIMDGE